MKVKTKGILVCNSATSASKMQVNVTTTVNSKQIRMETLNGREHYVLPSYTLPSNVVMNRVLYPAAEIDKHYKGLEGTLAPLGHPTVDGEFVSASSPEGLNVGYVGAWNRNVQKSGDRIYMEKWVDVEVAGRTENGKRLLEICKKAVDGEQVRVHTSVALFIDPQPVDNPEYDNVARIIAMDHDAILLDEPGAATPEQGVGLMVNADKASALHVHEGALEGKGYRQKLDEIDMAVRAHFVKDNSRDWAYCAEATDSQAIVVLNGEANIYSYTVESGKVVFGSEPKKVVQKTIWQAVKNALGFSTTRAAPATNQEKGATDMPMDEKERAALVADSAAAAAAALKPHFDMLAANMKAITDTLAANQRDAEAPMRAVVAEKLGEIAANALTGEALKQAHDAIKAAAPATTAAAAPVLPGVTGNSATAPAVPALGDYFPKA